MSNANEDQIAQAIATIAAAIRADQKADGVEGNRDEIEVDAQERIAEYWANEIAAQVGAAK